jgi:transcriptional regulator
MYIPAHFLETDADKLAAIIDEHSFGTLVTFAGGRPFASHVPFLFERVSGLLLCHVARANPQWRHLAEGHAVLAIFHGPHAYISPTWYASPGVPTWNYVAVHVYGSARAIDDANAAQQHVERLAARNERGRRDPWVPQYDARMLQGIVGIEIRVNEIQGKFKLSQNRSVEDRARVAAALDDSGEPSAQALTRLMPRD